MAMVEQEVVRRRIAALSGHLLQAQDPGFAGLNAQVQSYCLASGCDCCSCFHCGSGCCGTPALGALHWTLAYGLQGCAAISTTLYAQPASETAYARVDTFSAGPDTSAVRSCGSCKYAAPASGVGHSVHGVWPQDSGPLFSRPVLDEEKPPMRSSTVQDSLHKVRSAYASLCQ